MSVLVSELKRLHALGFACILLHPKSKQPIGNEWQKGPRKSLKDLSAQYRKGMNLGVRLGEASKVGNGYLAVVDCDVKSAEPKHLKEMQEALAKIKPETGFEKAPVTRSGRGNGSAHHWYVTDQPAKSARLAQSSEKVKVKMGNTRKPTPADKAALSAQELKAGYRMRAAWEISLMGEGTQLVRPPSIHPDSGREYAWAVPLNDVADIPKLKPLKADGPKIEKRCVADFKLKPVDLKAAGVPDRIIDLINEGTDCEDRSGGLFKAAISLIRHGLTDDEIATALTEPDTYLGQCAFDHTQSKSRERAAKWVKKYTLQKARTEYDESNSFEPVTDEGRDPLPLSDEDSQAQSSELSSNDFRSAIDRSSAREGSKPKNTLKNVVTILRGEFGQHLFRLNEFSGFIVYGRSAPWGAKVSDELSDTQIAQIKHWFATHYRFEPNVGLINEAIMVLSRENAFHPVRDYLDTLEWDGKRRLDTWLKRLLGATESDAYLRSVGRKVVIAMVTRAYEPGRKFDQVLIMEGKQGLGKSRSIEALAGPEWYSDAPINLMDKDGILSMRATWVMELGELSGMRKADVDQLKEFISRKVDRIRVPYGRHMENFPRQCIFIGSTNNSEYLKDTTGNRRFWPIAVGECDVEGVAREREQLLAEAKFAYELGEELWITDEAARIEAEAEQSARVFIDEWAEKLQAFFESDVEFNREQFQLYELFEGVGPFADTKMDRGAQHRAAEALRFLGYSKKVKRVGKSNIKRVWVTDPENVTLVTLNEAGF